MVSVGGQAPHVLRAHVWALNACREPNEIESPTAANGVFYRPFPGDPLHGGLPRQRCAGPDLTVAAVHRPDHPRGEVQPVLDRRPVVHSGR